MKQVCPIAIVVLAVLGCGGLGCGRPPGTLPSVAMKLGNKTFDIEIARTFDEQETGLMRRDSLPDDHGMIFIFNDEQVVSFWMKDTRFPLDIMFLDSAGKIVSIRQMVAYDHKTTSSQYPARYAIELNKDAAAGAGLRVGDHIDIPPEAASKP